MKIDREIDREMEIGREMEIDRYMEIDKHHGKVTCVWMQISC